MAEIINFEKLTINKMVEKNFAFNQLEFEILLTVIKFIYAYIPAEFDRPMEQIQPTSNIEMLFEGDSIRFLNAFAKLMNYWEITSVVEEELPEGKELNTFETIEDLCVFVEGKVRAS
jgi:hypothetical protein